MNMNQIINMFTRLVMRRAMNWGINKGMDQLSRRGQTGEQPEGQPRPRQDKQTRDMAKKMRTLGRMTRR
ncbi:hypothetical protein [Paracoccus sp. (in: a-proteobacteria)]|uniref:hypothetical protein n=1 Tax=Paracoccus sp. TaxID=267 RepID=UPI00272D9D0D|nr:hypothetical protein [Paracoccus sp. (in: a-proteobacteria)]